MAEKAKEVSGLILRAGSEMGSCRQCVILRSNLLGGAKEVSGMNPESETTS